MIWEYLDTAADVVWYCVMAGMIAAIAILLFGMGIGRARRLMQVVNLVAVVGQLMYVVAELGMGNVYRVPVHLLTAALFLYWWWRNSDDDWKNKRRKAAREMGEKGKATIRRMVEQLKPVPNPVPVPGRV